MVSRVSRVNEWLAEARPGSFSGLGRIAIHDTTDIVDLLALFPLQHSTPERAL